MTVAPSSLEQASPPTGRREPGRRPPWDIGEPQPVVAALAEAGEFSGEVLDIGCGPGDNAIFLAALGYRVTGLDSAPSAIRTARERAGARGVEADFAVADATELAGYEGRFDTILDSGLYHCLSGEVRRTYVQAIARAGRPSARLHLISFAGELPGGTRANISRDDLRGHVVAPWVIEEISRTWYKLALTREQLGRHLPAADDVGPDVLASLETDDLGRVSVTAWHLVARLPGHGGHADVA